MLPRLHRKSKFTFSTRYFNSKAKCYLDSQIVLNRDLYKANRQINSNKKIAFRGPKPSVFDRSAADFESKYLDPTGLGDHILEFSEYDKDFQSAITERAQSIQTFLGEDFNLLVEEQACIIFGLFTFPVQFEEIDEFKNPQTLFPRMNALIYTSDRFRILGKSLFELHLNLATIFENGRYLSLPANEVAHRLHLTNNDTLICNFMRNHLLYDSIQPYRGTFRAGLRDVSDPEIRQEINLLSEKIHDKTCVGSFYTLLGLLAMKYDKTEVIDKILHKKILNGPSGIIKLLVNEITQSRS